MSLKELFTSKENAEFLIDCSLSNVKNEVNVDKHNPYLIKIFNEVAVNVFKYEKNKCANINPVEALKIINNIVINELSKFIISNPSKFISDAPVPVKKTNQTVESSFSLKTVDTVYRMSLESCVYNSSIKNVTGISLLNLSMYNEDYTVNYTNNTLVLSHNNKEYEVIIPEGNYTPLQLAKEVEATLDLECLCGVNAVSGKFEIRIDTEELCKINREKSTLLNIIGDLISTGVKGHFISESPIKLIKHRRINLKVKMYDTEDAIICEYIEPLLLHDTHYIYKLDFSKKFQDIPIEINKITIDFGDYNHRGYPFYLLMEISQKTI